MTLAAPEAIEARVLALLGRHMRSGAVPRPGTDIVADTGMDSVAVMDFVLDLEDAFDISIPLNRLAEVRTAADVAGAVAAIAAETARSGG